MPDVDPRAGLFPALLKYWRGQRGLSQLDLAIAADVSSRHISFLETARSQPSPQMVHRLAAVLDVPLRHVDEMLRAAGHATVFARDPTGALPPIAARALAMLMEHHDPHPVIAVDRTYRVVDANTGAAAVLTAALDRAPDPTIPLNLVRATFDPSLVQPSIVNFDQVGQALLWRLQREVLADPDDGPLRRLLEEVLAMPTVDPSWRSVDLGVPSDPALILHLRLGDAHLRFITMVTAFQAPQQVAVAELRIEQWLPIDTATTAACRELVTSFPQSATR